MPPAARVTDMHTCPMVTPGVPPVPHVGGPITGPGMPTVLIGGLPAACVGDLCVCVGPPDSVVKGRRRCRSAAAPPRGWAIAPRMAAPSRSACPP
jgi:uncharacterized Zn-binding protein involved in type VI secretion